MSMPENLRTGKQSFRVGGHKSEARMPKSEKTDGSTQGYQILASDFGFRTSFGIRNFPYTPLNAAKPPSIGITTPVTKPEASAEVSHSSGPTKSSGVPNRLMGVWVMMVLARGVSEPS